MSIFGYFVYLGILNMVTVGTIIRICFRYIGYLVIFMFLYISTEPTQNFVIPERSLILKFEKFDT